ncbi:hypothetical protein [Caldimonas brevitalea]|uniref:DUF4184 family protein n=1 Tax=Caldimonas brevitalea TaxID=413882 RepID=A0A0G3BKU3_9BURK|nr:hypothetical protein [Caldimonas brevitalea]AKJ27160.1 hypothetical protein AAW51_0469 [Caldimonas brevitalea]
MPITPFHFGPGALLQSVAPRHVSFLSFCAANVLIDLESLYNLVYRQHPVHAFFHTYLGATLVIAATGLLFLACQWFARRFWLPNLLGWRSLMHKQVLVGAALGAYTHAALDSVMHQDIQPLWPFSTSNALLGVISLGVLHTACLALGLLGLLIVATRWFVAGEEKVG